MFQNNALERGQVQTFEIPGVNLPETNAAQSAFHEIRFRRAIQQTEPCS